MTFLAMLKSRSTLFFLMMLFPAAAMAQQASTPAPGAPTTVQQSVTVTTTAEPLPLDENDRSVSVLDTREQPLLFNSVEGYLRTDSALDLEERGPEGVQADLSIRGTTFEQSLVLVNGLRVNDPETGHLNMDIPVPLEAVGRVDVLRGSGSTFYGSDAIGGAVNLITLRPERTSAAVKLGFGNYGSEEQHLRLDFAGRRAAEEVSGSRDASDGFIADRGYHSNAAASETWLTTRLGATDILLAGSDRPYGANQFYGPYDSTERTKGWLAAAQQQLGRKTAASFSYLKHTDEFVLFAGQPTIYENNHDAKSYEGALRRADTFGANTTLSYGLEESGESIVSTNLGVHARNQGAGYANLSMRAVPGATRLSFSVGAREEVLSSNGGVFSPSVAAAFALTSTLRLRAAVGHGFRLPTFLDLYYSDPTTIGNPALKPESSWSYEGGAEWRPGTRVTASVTGFTLRQVNGIDYSKYSLSAQWQAMNVSSLAYSGVETSVRVRLTDAQRLEFGYTGIRAGSPPPGLISEYAFNYPAQNAVAAWQGELGQVVARTQVRVVQRTGQTAYPVWDVSAARGVGAWRPYLRLTNLANTGYAEVPGVRVQGRTVMGGVEIRLK